MADSGLRWVSDTRDVIHIHAVNADEQRASWRDVLDDWEDGGGATFIALVMNSGLDAVFWESAPIAGKSLDEPYQAVLLAAPALARMRPDASPFANIAAPADADVIDFPSLGRDAHLVAPTPRDGVDYAHLVSFGRHASPATQIELWQRVAARMRERVRRERVWLSTSGLGVSWLHVRLDSRPKYYQYSPFRDDG